MPPTRIEILILELGLPCRRPDRARSEQDLSFLGLTGHLAGSVRPAPPRWKEQP